VLSTSPYDESTHWKQTIFYLSEPLNAKAGDIIKGRITASKAASNPREIDVKLNYSFNKIEKKTEHYRIS
jgi:protein arginine N-methyltransferase 1